MRNLWMLVCAATMALCAQISSVSAQAPGEAAPVWDPSLNDWRGMNYATPMLLGTSQLPVGSTFFSFMSLNGVGGTSSNGHRTTYELGYSFGDPVDFVNVTTSVSFVGRDPTEGNGYLSVQLSRLLGQTERSATYLSLSVREFAGWGTSADDDPVYNASLVHQSYFTLGNGIHVPFQVLAGWGSSNTVPVGRVGRTWDGYYYGMGFGLSEQLSTFLFVNETQTNLGFTYTPRDVPSLRMTFAVYDLADRTHGQTFAFNAVWVF